MKKFKSLVFMSILLFTFVIFNFNTVSASQYNYELYDKNVSWTNKSLQIDDNRSLVYNLEVKTYTVNFNVDLYLNDLYYLNGISLDKFLKIISTTSRSLSYSNNISVNAQGYNFNYNNSNFDLIVPKVVVYMQLNLSDLRNFYNDYLSELYEGQLNTIDYYYFILNNNYVNYIDYYIYVSYATNFQRYFDFQYYNDLIDVTANEIYLPNRNEYIYNITLDFEFTYNELNSSYFLIALRSFNFNDYNLSVPLSIQTPIVFYDKNHNVIHTLRLYMSNPFGISGDIYMEKIDDDLPEFTSYYQFNVNHNNYNLSNVKYISLVALSLIDDFGNYEFNNRFDIENLEQSIKDNIFISTRLSNYTDMFSLEDIQYRQGYERGLKETNENAYNDGYREGYNNGYSIGHKKGYDKGLNTEFEPYSFLTGLFGSQGIGKLFRIELISGISLGSVIMIPLTLSLMAFVLNLIKGRWR